ncbi:hypothetical protein CsSME_00009713 [Camellia sinensis var. sinensis]
MVLELGFPTDGWSNGDLFLLHLPFMEEGGWGKGISPAGVKSTVVCRCSVRLGRDDCPSVLNVGTFFYCGFVYPFSIDVLFSSAENGRRI